MKHALPDQHYPELTPRDRVLASFDAAKRNLDRIEVPAFDHMTFDRSRASELNYIDIAERVSEIAADLMCDALSEAVDKFDRADFRKAIKDMVDDELFDARAAAEEPEEV